MRGFFAGSREFKYIALANVPGKYVLPSSVAEDIDNPTYTGMSGSAYFWVQGDANTGGSMFAAATIETPALARRKLLIDATAPRCAAAEDSYGGWCDEASGKWMCGQAECGTSSLPAGCAVVDGEVRCGDWQPPPTSTPTPDTASAAARAPSLVLVWVLAVLSAVAGWS